MFTFYGHTFETIDEVIEFIETVLFPNDPNMAAKQVASVTQYGHTTTGVWLLKDGTRQYGSFGSQLRDLGWIDENGELTKQLETAIKAKQGASEYAELGLPRTFERSTFDGQEYINKTIPLGDPTTTGGSSGSITTMTDTMAGDTGAVKTVTKTPFVEKIENPEVPGTFSYLATLKMLGWLPLPTWTAFAAPLLGVTVGLGAYDLDPDFWDGLAQKLLPYTYQDPSAGSLLIDTLRLPIAFAVGEGTADKVVYTLVNALQALREYFLEKGVFDTGSTREVDSDSVDSSLLFNNKSGYTFPMACTDPIGMSWSNGRDATVYTIDSVSGVSPVYALMWRRNNYDTVLIVSQSAFSYVRSSTQGRSSTMNSTASTSKDGSTIHFHVATSGRVGGATEVHMQSDIPMTTVTLSSDTNVNRDIAYMVAYLSTGGSGGVPGMEPEPDATYPTDTSQTLDEIYPTWGQKFKRGMADPSQSTYESGTTPWAPVTLSDGVYRGDVNISNSTGDQSTSQSGENPTQSQLEQILEAIKDLSESWTREGVLPENPPTNPPVSDDSPNPTPPVITGAGSDLIAIYNPTKQEIIDFNSFLWSLDPTNLANWGKVIQNPIEAIVSLHMLYVTPTTGASQHIKCGYIESDVSSAVVTNQYVDIDCGSVGINEHFMNIWDYDATEIQIYLPFIGIVPLHTSDVMKSTLRVKYRVDVLTGSCLAQIIVSKEGTTATLYTFPGNCAVPLPLTGGSFSGLFSALLTTVGATIVGGPAYGAGRAVGQLLRGEVRAHVSRSGNLGSNVGALGARIPYVIITRNKSLDAYMYNSQYGYPANMLVLLNNMHGYTKIKSIHLSGIPCTDNELELIEQLLKEGVIIN